MQSPLLFALFAATGTVSSTTAERSDREASAWDVRFERGEGAVVEMKGVFGVVARVRGQFLYEIEDTASDRAEQSFSIRRARLGFSGYVFDPAIGYKLELAFSPSDVAVRDGIPTQSPLFDMYFRFSHLRDLTLQVGQYKVPFDRERIISSGELNLVDRSITNAEFSLERDLGFDLRSKDLFGLGFLRYYLGLYIGEGRNTFELSDFGLMYLARVEVLPLGLFDDHSEGDLSRTEDPRLSIGLAYSFLDEAKRDRGIIGRVPTDGGTTDFHVFTADLIFLWSGASLLSAFFFREGDRNPIEGATDVDLPRDAYGFFVQPAYVFPWFDLEIAARFSRIVPRSGSSVVRSSELGGGLNYYFYEHSLKLQADYFHLWRRNDLGNGEDVFRLQLQAAF